MKAKIPLIPETLPLPNFTIKSDPIPRGQLLIAVMLAGIFLTITIYIIMHNDNETNLRVSFDNNQTVKCEYPTGVEVRNNMQASHAYKEEVISTSNLPGTYYIKADDYGSLWGSSMQPTFFEGNSVLLQDYTNKTIIHTGDIIRYFRYTTENPNCTVIRDRIANNSLGGSIVNNNMAVIHRINAIYDDIVITQGDNLYEQERIDKCQITDIVIGIIFT